MKNSTVERVTVTLPNSLVREMDRRETNRSRFVADAVRHELEFRRQLELRRSLDNPHPETLEIAEMGFQDWVRGLPDEDSNSLVDMSAGKSIRWLAGEGWAEVTD